MKYGRTDCGHYKGKCPKQDLTSAKKKTNYRVLRGTRVLLPQIRLTNLT